jgi:hypothetical protein
VARYAERLRPLAQDVDFAAMAVNAPALTARDLVDDTGHVVATFSGRFWGDFVDLIAFA